MRVRPMTADDVDQVASLCGQLGYPSTTGEVAARFAALAAAADHAVFVAEDEQSVPDDESGRPLVGWVHVHRSLTLEADAFAEIGGLVVREGTRGRGVGRALMRVAERWATDHGYTEMRVRSNVIREKAHQFYRGLGYGVIKSQVNFRKRLLPESAHAGGFRDQGAEGPRSEALKPKA